MTPEPGPVTGAGPKLTTPKTRRTRPLVTLLVLWNEDAGNLGQNIAGFLSRQLPFEDIAQLEPVSFFPLNGVTVVDDVTQFPDSRLYLCKERKLAIFQTSPPRYEWYGFLNTMLDMVEHYCRIKELYTIGAMVSLSSHAQTRDIMPVASNPEMRSVLSRYGLIFELNHETPPSQRPTFNSFLIWNAHRRNIHGATLWASMPFYMVGLQDPASVRTIVSFIDRRLKLGLNLSQLDKDVSRQNSRVREVRRSLPEVDDLLRRIESRTMINEEDSEKILKALDDYLKKHPAED
jgi:predicted ATP-grasp superfamily ATP-dependent carboligase